MRVAIIGATGFIGRRLCEACIRRGDSVTALVRSTEAREEMAQRGVTVIHGMLTDEEAIRRTCSSCDVVFNLAGALGKWGKSSDELQAVNSIAAGLIVGCATKAGADKVVHASTAGVSGPLPYGATGCEADVPHPVTEYQKTKLAGESAALDKHASTGIPLVIVRPSFVYGPGDTHKLSLFRTVAAGRMILVNGGKSRLHPVFVEDVVEGLLVAAERAPGNGEVYIIGGESPASTREIVAAIAASLKLEAPKFSMPEGLLLPVASAMEALGRVTGKEPPLTRSKVKLLSENYAYSINRAKSELGFEPAVGLMEGITRTVEWYRTSGLL